MIRETFRETDTLRYHESNAPQGLNASRQRRVNGDYHLMDS